MPLMANALKTFSQQLEAQLADPEVLLPTKLSIRATALYLFLPPLLRAPGAGRACLAGTDAAFFGGRAGRAASVSVLASRGPAAS